MGGGRDSVSVDTAELKIAADDHDWSFSDHFFRNDQSGTCQTYVAMETQNDQSK